MSDIQIFDVGQDTWQLGIAADGRSYAIAADVAPTFDYRDATAALKVVDDDEKAKLKLKMPVRSQCIDAGQDVVEYRNRQVWVIYEDGLWELIFRSTKPEAKVIKKRVKAILRKLRADGMVVDEQRITDDQIEAGKDRLDSLAQRRLEERMDYKSLLHSLKLGGAVSDEYRMVQNTLYTRVLGMTASRIRDTRTQLTGDRLKRGDGFTKASSGVAKNYLTEGELKQLNGTVLATFAQIQVHYPDGTNAAQMLAAINRAADLVLETTPASLRP